MVKRLFMVGAVLLASVAHPQVSGYNVNLPLMKRAGCVCETNAERDAFLSRYSRAQSRILLNKYSLSAGVVLANTQTAQGNLSGAVTYDTSEFITAQRPWDFVIVVSGIEGF